MLINEDGYMALSLKNNVISSIMAVSLKLEKSEH